MKISHRKLLFIGIAIITMSCISLPEVTLPTVVPTFDSSSLITQINVEGSSNWIWNEVPAPTFEPRPQNNPQLVIGLDGKLHLFWDTLSSGEAFIYHSYFQDGIWSDPLPISLTLGKSKLHKAPIISSDGIIHILWYNELKSGGPYRLLYAQYDGINWSEENEVYVSEKDLNLRGELFVDTQSNIHAVIKAPVGINSDLFYLTKTPEGWSSSEAITPKITDGLVFWRYKPNQSSGIRLYGKDLMGNLRISSWENGVVGDVTKTEISLPIYDTYFIDNAGNYYIYWTGQAPIPGGAVTGAYYQCISNSLLPWSETILSGEKTVVTKPLVAQNQSKSVLAWITKDDKMEFLFPNGCESADIYNLDLPEIKLQRQLASLAISNTSETLCTLNEVGFGNFKLYCAELPQ